MKDKYGFQKIDENKYREIEAINYSKLASNRFSENDSLKKESKALNIGSYIDAIVFNSSLDDFYVEDPSIRKPGENTNMYKFIKECVNREIFIGWMNENPNERFLKLKSNGPEMFQFQTIYSILEIKRPSLDDFIDILYNDFYDYYTSLYQSKNKKYISREDDMISTLIVNELRSNIFTKDYFTNVILFEKENLFQVPIIIKYNGYSFKCLIDIIHINHEDKTIRPLDLKTMTGNPEDDFISSFFKYKLYLQAGLYRFILEKYIKFTEFKDYTVLPFCFIPIGKTSETINPLLFEITNEDHEIALNGGYFKNSFYPVKGVFELVEEYNKLKNLNDFRYYSRTVENNGIVPLIQ